MANKNQETTTETKAPETIVTTTAELAQLVAAAVAAATKQSGEISAQIIADALIESRKPYVSEESKLNEEMFRKNFADIERRKRQNERASQEQCPHNYGGAGERPDPTQSSFIMHYTDAGDTWGMCTVCGKQIWGSKPEDRKWFSGRRPASRPSASGRRQFMDPRAAMAAARPLPQDETLDEIAPAPDAIRLPELAAVAQS